ncbi:MAG: F0F1 ATP synthase subunit B [Verrucomicrobiae bacterium]|nr:F0F1 ATP synthase subunit B [Verrucomicrobiae bacterium]
MNYLMLAAAEAGQGDSPLTQLAREFSLEPRLLISQLVLFVIVAVVLAKFAYKPLLGMLEMRKAQISESLENAKQTREELAKAQVKAQEIVNAASAQANKAIEEARAAAAKVQEQETQKAIAAANDIIAKARQASEAELARMKAELRKEIGRLVVATSAKVTGEILTPDQQKHLAEETNRQLAHN